MTKVQELQDKLKQNLSVNLLEREVDRVVHESKNLGYHPHRFQTMRKEIGTVASITKLLNKPAQSKWIGSLPNGLVRLWELGRLDLSFEYVVIKPVFNCLFPTELQERARRRLELLGYNV